MIIILSYFQDGSGRPMVEFFPETDGQAKRIAVYLAEDKGLTHEIFEINDFGEYPNTIYPLIGED